MFCVLFRDILLQHSGLFISTFICNDVKTELKDTISFKKTKNNTIIFTTTTTNCSQTDFTLDSVCICGFNILTF